MYLTFAELTSFWLIIYLIYAATMTGVIILDNKPPQSSLAWLLTVYFLPFVGLFIYLLAGVNWKKHKILQQRPEEVFKEQLDDVIQQQRNFMDSPQCFVDKAAQPDIKKAVRLLSSSSHTPVTLYNQAQIFDDGRAYFEQMKADLQAAQDFIHMEFFIWKSDKLGTEVADILCQQARNGVEVRLIFDGVGCFWKMSRAYKRRLREAGVDYRIFLDPLTPRIAPLANYLNHRKIVVIDGQISYLGGMNLADEYIDGGPHFDSWRDTGVRFEGEITQQLQTVFVTDWYNSSQILLKHARYFPKIKLEHQPAAFLPVQLACSGPDSDWPSIKQLLFNLIINADHTVYIQSPYFIPDTGIMDALSTAALSGVEIHLMMTGQVDKRMPYWAAETYFEPLLKAGVKIYRYQAGFLHAKTICVDNTITSIGTCNMDIRSFDLDYEVNAVFYDRRIARELLDQFQRDLKHCDQLQWDNLNRRNLFFKLRNSLFRLFSPLM